MFAISEDAKKKVYETFGRTEEMVNEDVETMKEWMKSQPHFPEIMADAQIRNFLNLNKFSFEKTKLKIDMYYTMRSLMPEFFNMSNPNWGRLQRMMDKMHVCTFPEALDGIHRVIFVKVKERDVLCFEEFTMLLLAVFEVRLHEDFMFSDIMILDMKHVSLNDVQKLTPSLLKKLIVLLQRIQVHTNDKIMHEIFTKDQIPKDLGGNGPFLQELSDEMRRKFSEYQERFDLLDTLKVDESLRPEKLNNDEVLGFYGNFRKLDVD